MFTAYAGYATRLIVDIAAIFLLAYVLYFRRHRRADLLLAYVALNIGIFVAISLLASVRVDIALGFGLFAILSIIRLRSSTVTQQEVAYYFVALVMGLVNGMDIADRRLVVLINAVLLVAMAVVDSKPLRERSRRTDVHLDVVHSDDASLVADLERRLGGTVLHHEVNDVDYVPQDDAGRRALPRRDAPRAERLRTSGSWTSRWTSSTPTTPRWSPTSSAGSAGRCCCHRVKDIDYVRDTMEVEVRYRVWTPVAPQLNGATSTAHQRPRRHRQRLRRAEQRRCGREHAHPRPARRAHPAVAQAPAHGEPRRAGRGRPPPRSSNRSASTS